MPTSEWIEYYSEGNIRSRTIHIWSYYSEPFMFYLNHKIRRGNLVIFWFTRQRMFCYFPSTGNEILIRFKITYHLKSFTPSICVYLWHWINFSVYFTIKVRCELHKCGFSSRSAIKLQTSDMEEWCWKGLQQRTKDDDYTQLV